MMKGKRKVKRKEKKRGQSGENREKIMTGRINTRCCINSSPHDFFSIFPTFPPFFLLSFHFSFPFHHILIVKYHIYISRSKI